MERGEQIEHDIEDALKKCDIYVLLVGNKYSEWTEKEFNMAWTSGIPIKAYLIRSRQVPSNREAQRQRRFLELVHSRVRLQGKDRPYGRGNLLRLYNDIANDTAAIVLKSVHDHVAIRRILRR